MNQAAQQGHESLQSYLGRVQKVVASQLGERVWVIAELHEFSTRPNGTCYFALIESEDGVEIAKCQAVMFQSIAKTQLAQFEAITGSKPAVGMKVLLRLAASFNPQYGFQLQIFGLDPNYTLGDMHARINEIVLRLREEGIYGWQKELPKPIDFWRVAVISPDQGAGLGDFRRESDLLEGLGLVKFTFFPALFQGPKTYESIREVLIAIFELNKQTPFDAVCIIRGGGAKADLAWLNDYRLAKVVCRIPIPVFTGIGHERDETVLDMVAHECFSTPSKVIGAIHKRVQSHGQDLMACSEWFSAELDRILLRELSDIDRLDARFQRNVAERITGEILEMKEMSGRYRAGFADLFHRESSMLQRNSGAWVSMLGEFVSTLQASLQASWHSARVAVCGVCEAQIAAITQCFYEYKSMFPSFLQGADRDLEQFAVIASKSVERIIAEQELELNRMTLIATDRMSRLLREEAVDFDAMAHRFVMAGNAKISTLEQALDNHSAMFDALDPRSVMAKGFALVRDADGAVVKSAMSVKSGSELSIQLVDGKVLVIAR